MTWRPNDIKNYQKRATWLKSIPFYIKVCPWEQNSCFWSGRGQMARKREPDKWWGPQSGNSRGRKFPRPVSKPCTSWRSLETKQAIYVTECPTSWICPIFTLQFDPSEIGWRALSAVVQCPYCGTAGSTWCLRMSPGGELSLTTWFVGWWDLQICRDVFSLS